MSLWTFVKTFGDVCIYYSVINAFPGLFGGSHSFLWTAVLCAAGVTVGELLSEYGKPALRFVGIILQAATFLLAGNTLEYLILIPPFLYGVILILRDQNALEYYSYRHFFRRSVSIWCIYFAVICLLYYFEYTTQPWRNSLDYRMPLLCGLIYMLCGVLVQRQLRMGQESKSVAGSVQVFAVLGGVSAFLLGLVAAERFLRDRVSSVMQLLQKALIVIFTAPLTVMAELISSAFYGRFEILDEPSSEQVQYTEAPLENGFPPPVLGTAAEQAGETGFPWWLVILILAVMVAVMLLMMRVFQQRRIKVKTPVEETVLSSPAPGKVSTERSNRAKVRQIYRRFLRQQRGLGIRLRRDQTSADILQNISASTDPKAAAQLRVLYLAARYGERHEITVQDVAAAKTAFRNTREKKDKL